MGFESTSEKIGKTPEANFSSSVEREKILSSEVVSYLLVPFNLGVLGADVGQPSDDHLGFEVLYRLMPLATRIKNLHRSIQGVCCHCRGCTRLHSGRVLLYNHEVWFESSLRAPSFFASFLLPFGKNVLNQVP